MRAFFRLTLVAFALGSRLLTPTPSAATTAAAPTTIHVDFKNTTDRYAWVTYGDAPTPQGHVYLEYLCIPPHQSVERSYAREYRASDDPKAFVSATIEGRDCKGGGNSPFSPARHFISKGRSNDLICTIFEKRIVLHLDPRKL